MILIAPLLAFILDGFVLLVLCNELALFGKIKEAYRRKQNRFLDYDLWHSHNDKSRFELFEKIYFFILMALIVINGFIVWKFWLPKV